MLVPWDSVVLVELIASEDVSISRPPGYELRRKEEEWKSEMEESCGYQGKLVPGQREQQVKSHEMGMCLTWSRGS